MTNDQPRGTQSPSLPTGGQEGRETEQRHLVTGIGPLEIDAPRAAGYYGGLALGLAFGLIEPPLAVFIAVVPLFKLLTRPGTSQTEWAIGEVLEGAATPVGGSASPVVRVAHTSRSVADRGPRRGLLDPLRRVWTDAQQIADAGKR